VAKHSINGKMAGVFLLLLNRLETYTEMHMKAPFGLYGETRD